VTERVGFIGVGHIGAPMARRLLAGGCELFIRDANPRAVKAFEGTLGVTVCGTPREVARRAPVVLLSLSSPGALGEVVLGQEGILAAGTAATTIDLSTSGVAMSRRVAAEANAAGVPFLDSPVSGGVEAAAQGTLTVMAAGAVDVFERWRPLLEQLGTRVFHVGTEPGLGQVIKLANNILAFGSFVAAVEALLVVKKAGVSPEAALEVINSSSGRSRTTEGMLPAALAARSFCGGGHVSTTFKDARLFEELAEELAVPMVVNPAVVNAWRIAMGHGLGDRDFTTIVEMFERWSGVPLRRNGESATR
jgi:3-hydroxyisobutyrate dehydrogenase-like beta-hydroxyacid dehydrogenase